MTDLELTALEIAEFWGRNVNPNDETRHEAVRYITQQLMHGINPDDLKLAITRYGQTMKRNNTEPRYRKRLKTFVTGGLGYEPFRAYLEHYVADQSSDKPPREFADEAPKEQPVSRDKYVQIEAFTKQFGTFANYWKQKKAASDAKQEG